MWYLLFVLKYNPNNTSAHQNELIRCFFASPGFTDENIDEIKETLVGSNLYLLVLTAFITALQVREHINTDFVEINVISFLNALFPFFQQLICEFLALKNDISSWRKKKSMAGISRKTGDHNHVRKKKMMRGNDQLRKC